MNVSPSVNSSMPLERGTVAAQDDVKVSQAISSTVNKEQEASSAQAISVTRVAPEAIKLKQAQIERYSSPEQNQSSRASAQQAPTAQYQSNQQLLERQEIDQLVGVDLFV